MKPTESGCPWCGTSLASQQPEDRSRYSMSRGSEQDLSTLPRSREEARARGFDRFYTGVPCKHGHLAARYVSTTNCAACQVEHARKNGGWGARPSREQFFAQARELIEARGGALISTTCLSAKSKLHVRCDRGHEFETNFDRLKQGKWCPRCKSESHAQRMTADLRPVEELREFARRQHSGDCLAVAPSPMLLKVRWKCANEAHPPFEATIAKVLHSDQWCPACWQERRQPPNPQVELETVAALVRERGGEILKVGKKQHLGRQQDASRSPMRQWTRMVCRCFQCPLRWKLVPRLPQQGRTHRTRDLRGNIRAAIPEIQARLAGVWQRSQA